MPRPRELQPFDPLLVLSALLEIRDAKRARLRRPKKPRGPNRRTLRKIQLALSQSLRIRLHHALRGAYKNGSAVRDLGCTIAELRVSLERQFQEGMTWQNYGAGPGRWCIDHIFPLSRARLTDREQLLRVCHYTNLQPLWWGDNVRKGARIPGEHQRATAR